WVLAAPTSPLSPYTTLFRSMARWLNEWVRQFAEEVPDAVPTATLYPEPDVSGYVEEAVRAGARCVKVHVQVGAFDPRDPVLDPADRKSTRLNSSHVKISYAV